MIELDGRTLADRYHIAALIGRGGMADVYRGTDTVLDRPIAIKILTDRSDDIRKRFLREAQSMARLNHRNIVSVYDAGQSDGLSYIVMELVEFLGHCVQLALGADERCFPVARTHLTAPWLAGAALLVL